MILYIITIIHIYICVLKRVYICVYIYIYHTCFYAGSLLPYDHFVSGGLHHSHHPAVLQPVPASHHAFCAAGAFPHPAVSLGRTCGVRGN